MAFPDIGAAGSPESAIFAPRSLVADPIIGMRFGVFFFASGVIPNPLDIRFQKVTGLSTTLETEPLREGGQNLYQHKLPLGVRFDNLVLERGMVVGSPLNLEFNTTLSLFRFSTSNVLVTLLGENKLPLAAWLFMKAYPVKWSTSDLDAAQPGLVIDRMELAYTRMQTLRV
jgi:phage tail-like protein